MELTKTLHYQPLIKSTVEEMWTLGTLSLIADGFRQSTRSAVVGRFLLSFRLDMALNGSLQIRSKFVAQLNQTYKEHAFTVHLTIYLYFFTGTARMYFIVISMCWLTRNGFSDNSSVQRSYLVCWRDQQIWFSCWRLSGTAVDRHPGPHACLHSS